MSACPSREQLALLLAERLSDAETADVESHVQGCAPCQQMLDALSGQDPLTRDIEGNADGSGKRDAARAVFLERLRQLAPARSATGTLHGGGETITEPAARTLPHVAGYELLAELGRGGMGVVYKARQTRLGRVVALKMLLAGSHAGPHELARFRTEAEAIARLQNPHIVQVFDVGEENGCPYLALEYVEGGNLADKVRAAPLPARAAAELVAVLASAVQAAHQSGVVHRDLKPANVLLTAEGTPKITDFGLAKRLDAAGGSTQSSALLGTPNYMAPEQAEGRHVGPAADVYGLGAILYYLLTGRPPFLAETPLDTLLLVRTADPIRPSVLQPKVSRELETVVLKAIAKEPARRYPTASALAEDLRRFLAGRPVLARRSTALEQTWRWCRRNPVVASLAAFVIALLIALLAGVLIHNASLQEQLERAEQAERDKSLQLGRAEKAEAKALHESKLAREAEQAGRQRLWESYLAQANGGRFSGQAGQRFRGLDALAKAAVIRPSLELRNEAIGCMALQDFRAVTLDELPTMDTIGAWALAVTTDKDGNVILTQKRNGARIAFLPSRHSKATLAGSSPDGNWVAVKHAGQNPVWVIWDWRRVKPVFETTQAPSTPFGWCTDGGCFYYGGTDGRLHVHDLVQNKEVHRIRLRQAPPIDKLELSALSPDRDKLAVVGKQRGDLSQLSQDIGKIAQDKDLSQAAVVGKLGKILSEVDVTQELSQATVQVFDLRSGVAVAEFVHPYVHPRARWVGVVAWGPDNRLLATTCSEALYIWDVPRKKQQAVIERVRGDWSLVFSREANILASCGSSGLMHLSDPLTGTVLVRGSGSFAKTFLGERWLPGGWLVPSGLSEVALGTECRRLYTANRDYGPQAAFDPRGHWLALADNLGVRLFDLATFRETAFLDLGRCETVFFHPDGDLLTYSGKYGMQRWPVRPDPEQPAAAVLLGPPQRLHEPPQMLYPNWAAQGLDGQLAAVDHGRNQAVLLRADHPNKETVLGPQQGMRGVSLSPDGRWAATGHWVGTAINVWDTKTGRLVKVFPTPGDRCANALFTPDGRWLVGCLEREYRFWKVGTWEVDRVLRRKEQGWAGMAAMAPDHRLLAICDTVWEVKLLDLATNEEIARLPADPDQQILALSFSPDGCQLAVARSDGALLWDLRRVRAQLKDMGLDWNLPPYPPQPAPSLPLKVKVVP